MQLTQLHNNNYTEFNDTYQLVLPLNLDGLVPENDSVRLLSHILEGLDYTKLYKAYSSLGRKPAVEPQTMFKILTYAYSQNIYSSRKIETACRRDINFKWLLAGQKEPDHSTIDRFRKDYLVDAVDDLFYQFVKQLHAMGEIKFENVFIDGTKIEANANRYTFVWKKSVNKNEAKMYSKIENLVAEIKQTELQNFAISRETLAEDISAILTFLGEKQKEKGIEFVHGIGRRKTQIQKWTEELEEYQKRNEGYKTSNQLFVGRNSYSRTDTDATFMHMKDDHMRNSQLKPAYNMQIGVESEYVTGVGVFQDRNDIATLIPILEEMKYNLGETYTNVIADSGYESEENYRYLEENEQVSYIKPQTYEKWKKKSFKHDISKRENMDYIPEGDIYVCHNGRILHKVGTTHRTSATGYRSEVTNYECEECSGCPYKEKCTKANGNRRMQVSKTFVEKRQISYENILTEVGTELRMNRSIQVEGAFGVLKNDYNFNRFLTRGKNNVKTEFMLLCFGYNVNKFHAKIQKDRLGHHLHSLKKAA